MREVSLNGRVAPGRHLTIISRERTKVRRWWDVSIQAIESLELLLGCVPVGKSVVLSLNYVYSSGNCAANLLMAEMAWLVRRRALERTALPAGNRRSNSSFYARLSMRQVAWVSCLCQNRRLIYCMSMWEVCEAMLYNGDLNARLCSACLDREDYYFC